MNCDDCPYGWYDDDELVPACHYRNDGRAPCFMDKEPQDDDNIWKKIHKMIIKIWEG